MDMLDEDLLHFWTVLNEHGVKYIMIGGFAVNMYGYTRATNDVDLLLKDDDENRKKLAKAFSKLGYGNFAFDNIDFVPGWTNFNIGTGIQLDIMTSLKGVDLSFDACLQISPIAEIEGISIPFLHINQLIANKKVVNRPKDQIDVLELEKIREILNPKGPV